MLLSLFDGGESFDSCRQPALVLGHPGHELRVFGWMSYHRPRVYVITDGSGRTATSRLSSTARVLADLRAETDAMCGLASDAEMYELIMDGNIAWFLAVLDRMVESFVDNGTDLVAGDAMEGFNPTHDLCRVIVNGAVVAASRLTGRTIANYEFRLTEWEQETDQSGLHDSRCVHVRLDDDLLRKKVAAAECYVELKDEVSKALTLRGQEYFRIECLSKVCQPFPHFDASWKPYYEVWGERRVAEGAYKSVIRYGEHIMPIARAIRDRATGGNRQAVAAG